MTGSLIRVSLAAWLGIGAFLSAPVAYADLRDDLPDAFKALLNTQALIPNATKPEEHYHNARIHEQKGQLTEARRAYLDYFRFDLDYVDPHLRFSKLIRVQDGKAGAREVYDYLNKQSDSFVVDFGELLLAESGAKTLGLFQFANAHKDFGPALYELSLQFSARRKGKQTLADKRMEKELLERLFDMNKAGNFDRYYIDKDLAAKHLQDAKDRYAALKHFNPDAMDNPVKVNWMKSNLGWHGNIDITDTVLEIFWRPGTGGEFKSTGHHQHRSKETGYPIANPQVQLPFRDPPKTLDIKYRDISGAMRGPYTISFNPQTTSIDADKRILELTKNGWLAFRDFNGKRLVYFTHLMSYRGAISEIRYSLDGKALDRRHDFPPFDGQGTAKITDDVPIYIEVPKSTQSVSVQVTYKDGSKSEVVTIQGPG